MSEEQHNNTAFMKNVRNTHKYFTLMLRIPKTFKDNILSRMEICTNLKINCIPLRATSLCSLRSTTTTRAICFMVAVVGKYCSALCPDALLQRDCFIMHEYSIKQIYCLVYWCNAALLYFRWSTANN